jgi:predicted RNA-binding protein with PIN domain
MDNTVNTTLVSTSGAVIVGLGGMWISTNQLGKRIDDVMRRLDRLEDELRTFKDVVAGKFAALDLELAKLMDRSK